MNPEAELRRAIVEISRLLYERKLVVATDGNVSARLDRKHILITPSGFCKGFLREPDIVRIVIPETDSPPRTPRPLGKEVGRVHHQGTKTPRNLHLEGWDAAGEPGLSRAKIGDSPQTGTVPIFAPISAGASSETPMHLAVYQARPDIAAVIHAHPPYATSFAVSGHKLNHKLLPETHLFDGPIGRVPFLKAGSTRLAQAVALVLKSHRLCLLARHGAVTTGKTLLEAYYRLERLEFLAQVSATAR